MGVIGELVSNGQILIGNSVTGQPSVSTLSASNGIVVTNGPGTIGISFDSANVTSPYTTVNFGMSPYTVLHTDYYLSVDSSGGPISLIFPNSLVNHSSWVVKDRLGNAATNNITLSTTGGFTIDQSATYIISSNFGSIELLLGGTNFEVF